jgi:hypothetical protein
MTVQWIEPPAPKNRKWQPVIDQIKAAPGEWAFVGRISFTAGYKLAKQHNLEIQTANREGSQADVYLRATEETN